jgi:hypothetical protein
MCSDQAAQRPRQHRASLGRSLNHNGVACIPDRDLSPFLLAVVSYALLSTIALTVMDRFEVSVEISGSSTRGSDALLPFAGSIDRLSHDSHDSHDKCIICSLFVDYLLIIC